ncbi:MAG: hypothetical protein NT098_00965 [Candidatus Parcubacteria bacterium]|nr:hypothetical protein [Candidatus Parcubacteria bacterium]
MIQIKIARGISVLSILIGIMVMIGWYLDITILTSIMPQWIRMKIATAVCFVFSGIAVYFLSFEREEKKELRQIMLTIFPMLQILVMGTLFLGSIFGFQSGMENFAFVDRHETVTPIFQGRPSVATMIDFLLIAFISFLFNFGRPSKKTFSLIGFVVGIIGLVGAVGYLIHSPLLYYEIAGFSNAIAVHTTILFAFLGLAIFLIGRRQT